jgi:DNA mismatch endonuclease (patch repair protein)
VDSLTPAERSDRMSRIRGTDTVPELTVRRYLHSRGFRYRLHVSYLPGKPDLVLPRYSVAIFVHGCFWHAHSCQKGRVPATHSSFWGQKFCTNRARDARNARALRRMGWRVLTVWECNLNTSRKRQRALSRLERRILGVDSVDARA